MDKNIIKDEDIEWTTGTDKPYGQVVYEQWHKKLGQNPTKEEILRLRNEKMSLQSRIKKLGKELEQVHNDVYSGHHTAENILGMIELREQAVEHLTELYNHYANNLNDRELPDTLEIANQFVNNPQNTAGQYEAEEIKPTMDIAKDYINDGDIFNIYGHVHTIYKKATNLKGSKNQQKRWITFYADNAGLETSK